MIQERLGEYKPSTLEEAEGNWREEAQRNFRRIRVHEY